MKKCILFFSLAILCSCKGIVAGELSENRKRLHQVGNEENYCNVNPDKCINGVQW